MDANVNLNQCFKEIENIGSRTYQNICNGQLSTVPWGAGDWLLAIVMFIIVSVVLGVGGLMVWQVWQAVHELRKNLPS